MAKTTTEMSIKDKLEKVSDSFTVSIYDNGFLFDMGGRDFDGDWKSTKILCTDIDHLMALIKEAVDMPRDE